MKKNIKKNKIYERQRKKSNKKYEKYYDEKYLLVFLGAYAVTLQTAIPDISSNKTYENCIRSFSGFPLHDDNNLSFLIYVICVTSFLEKAVLDHGNILN